MRKRSMSCKKKQLNNKGMSLVEVLVAMIILAVVAGPILRTFVFSIQLSNRSKEKQRVTTAAQSIMEGFKAYSLDDICRQFNGLETCKVIANAGAVSETALNDHNGDGVADTSIIGGEFVPSPVNAYQFMLNNVQFESAYYDAKVDISVNTTNPISIQTVAKAEQMNAYLDAVFKGNSNWDALAYSEILNATAVAIGNELGSTFLVTDVDDSKIEIEKNTTVYIENGGVSGQNIVKVCVNYTYHIIDHPYDDGGTIMYYRSTDNNLYVDDSGNISSTYADMTVYDNAATVAEGATLENVYIYYYPCYKDAIGVNRECIYIQNDTGEVQNIYLVKQKIVGMSEGTMATLENEYDPVIAGTGTMVNLYHNLYANLASEAHGVHVTSSNFTGTITDKMRDASDAPIKTLVKTQSDVLLYDITVTIYKAGTTEQLAQISGTLND